MPVLSHFCYRGGTDFRHCTKIFLFDISVNQKLPQLFVANLPSFFGLMVCAYILVRNLRCWRDYLDGWYSCSGSLKAGLIVLFKLFQGEKGRGFITQHIIIDAVHFSYDGALFRVQLIDKKLICIALFLSVILNDHSFS